MELFEREDWTLFRTLSGLSQKAGVPVDDLVAVVAKELADNALDAGGICQVGTGDGDSVFFGAEILPIDSICVQDLGSGIPGTDEEVAALFSIGRGMRSSKLIRLPTRGALGNGLRVVVGAALASGGHIEVQTRGRSLRLCPRDDGTTQVERIAEGQPGGTTVRVYLGSALPFSYAALGWARTACLLARGETYKGKTSPHWYDADSFYELCQAAGARPVRELIADFDGCSGPKAGQIAASYRGRAASSLSRAETASLLAMARQGARSVQPVRLGSVGPMEGYTAYAKIEGTFCAQAARGSLHAEIPFVVEAWIAPYASAPKGSTDVDATVCVNRTPVTMPVSVWYAGREKRLWLSGGGLFHYLRNIVACPERLVLNVITPYMPITSDGKAPDLGYMMEEIADVIAKAARAAKRSQPTQPKPESGRNMPDAAIIAQWQEAAERFLGRSLKLPTLQLWGDVLATVKMHQPIRVRSVAYKMEAVGLIAKTVQDFDRVGTALTDMRRCGIIPYEWIVEGHRERARIATHDNVSSFMDAIKDSYVRERWKSQPYHVEVWCEKDGLADVIEPVCDSYQVPFVACKGQPSLTLLYTSAQAMKAKGKTTILLYYGDFDPRGLTISSTIKDELQAFGVDQDFRRMAVNVEQIEEYGLPTRPGKVTDNQHRAFVEQYGDECVDLDAFDVVDRTLLPRLVERAIRDVIDWETWGEEAYTEEMERAQLADRLSQGGVA
jgi:hypothetical protein